MSACKAKTYYELNLNSIEGIRSQYENDKYEQKKEFD